MFVLTVDQVGSTGGVDAVPDAIALVRRAVPGPDIVRAPRRTVGDEFQTVVGTPFAALQLCLALTRTQAWHVGCGIGPVDHPLPADTRAARGAAFVAARHAVEAAKKRPLRCAVITGRDTSYARDTPPARESPPGRDDLQPLLDLLLTVRARRSPEGWEVFDLLTAGRTQHDVAVQLGVSDQAVSARVRAGDIRVEEAALAPLVRLFAAADAVGPAGPADTSGRADPVAPADASGPAAAPGGSVG